MAVCVGLCVAMCLCVCVPVILRTDSWRVCSSLELIYSLEFQSLALTCKYIYKICLKQIHTCLNISVHQIVPNEFTDVLIQIKLEKKNIYLITIFYLESKSSVVFHKEFLIQRTNKFTGCFHELILLKKFLHTRKRLTWSNEDNSYESGWVN